MSGCLCPEWREHFCFNSKMKGNSMIEVRLKFNKPSRGCFFTSKQFLTVGTTNQLIK